MYFVAKGLYTSVQLDGGPEADGAGNPGGGDPYKGPIATCTPVSCIHAAYCVSRCHVTVM